MAESHITPEDADISRALVGGEDEIIWAIEQASKKHGPYLAGCVLRRFGTQLDPHDVTEAVDEALRAIWKMAIEKRYENRGSIRPLLATIVVRRALDIFKRKWPASEEDPPDNLVPADSVWNQILVDEFIERFAVFVTNLKKRQKIVGAIIAEYLHDYEVPPTIPEILAEIRRRGDIDTTEESVKTSLKEIRKKLRQERFYAQQI